MQRNLLPLALLACMCFVPAAFAQDSDSAQPMMPPASTDGGINTGVGTNSGQMDPGPGIIDKSVTDPNGDNTKSGGINSGPAGSLSDTGTIPSR